MFYTHKKLNPSAFSTGILVRILEVSLGEFRCKFLFQVDWRMKKTISTLPFYLSIGKKQLTSEFLWIDSTGITTGISNGIPAEKQMDSAYDFCEKMQNKTSNKTHMHKKCKTQVVHLKINPVFDTVKIITIYPSKQIFKGT